MFDPRQCGSRHGARQARSDAARIVAALALAATPAYLSSCGPGHAPYAPDRPLVDPLGHILSPPPAAPALSPADLLSTASEHPPTALARIDRVFERVALLARLGPGWNESEVEARIDSIRVEMDRLDISGLEVLRQRWGSLSQEEAALFRRAAALEMRWGLALMQTGEINDRVAGAAHLRQAMEWDPGNPLLVLLLSGYYDLAGFTSNGTGLLEEFLREHGPHDVISLQLERRMARAWTVTREPAQLDSAFAVCSQLARDHGGWGAAPAWLLLELARLHYLDGAIDSVRAVAGRASDRGLGADRDRLSAALALALMGICDVRDLEFERADRQFLAALALGAEEPILHNLVAWMCVPWDLWTEEQRMAFDRSADRLGFLDAYWATGDPILATPRVLEQRTEYRRRVAEAHFTLTGVDPATPGPLSEPGQAILRFGWPRNWESRGGQRKVAAESNPMIIAGVDRTWRLAYQISGPAGTWPETLTFQDGGSGARFVSTDSLASSRYPLFSFDRDFGGRAYAFHGRAARFRDPDGNTSLEVCFDTYVPDYSVRHPLSGLRFAGSIDVRACLYTDEGTGWTPRGEFALGLERETVPTARPTFARRSGTAHLASVSAGGARIASELLVRDAAGRLLVIGVENDLFHAPAARNRGEFALSDLMPIEAFAGGPPDESERNLGAAGVAYGTHLRDLGLIARACPFYLPEETFTFYLEAYGLARRNGRAMAELVLTIERLTELGEREYAIEISGRDQVLQREQVNEWHIARSLGLSTLRPGPHRLRAAVTDHQTGKTLSAAVEFRVVEPEDLVDFYGWRDLELPAHILSAAPSPVERTP